MPKTPHMEVPALPRTRQAVPRIARARQSSEWSAARKGTWPGAPPGRGAPSTPTPYTRRRPRTQAPSRARRAPSYPRSLRMSAFEELLTAWRKNPDAPSTIALARSLATSSDSELVREIGARALARHASNAEVMLAVGRMYLGSGALHEAQTALMQAGTIAP